MTFNPDIHQRRSIRLRDYDYSQAGKYFVTICAWQRECLFGEIVNGEMQLNDLGQTMETVWFCLPDHYIGIELDEFVIMPNHFHGIIDIVGAQFIAPDLGITSYGDKSASNQGAMNRAPTVGGVVRGFKARCTHAINIIRSNLGCPVWQRNYYERVIRNETELTRARDYIVNNPLKWELDKENPANLP